MDDSSDNSIWGNLFSTAKDVYGDVSSADAARRQSNTLNDLTKALSAKSKSPDLSKYLPYAIGAVVLIVLAGLFLRGKK